MNWKLTVGIYTGRDSVDLVTHRFPDEAPEFDTWNGGAFLTWSTDSRTIGYSAQFVTWWDLAEEAE